MVTLGYRAVTKALEDKDVRYTEFDFHNECKLSVTSAYHKHRLTDYVCLGKGMKYENISKLITQLAGTFSEQG